MKLPVAKLKPVPGRPFDGELDFSFSGLKTAVLRATQNMVGVGIDFPSYELADKLTHGQKALIAKSFEQTAVRTLSRNMKKAADRLEPKTILLAGGVAANRALRKELQKTFASQNFIVADFKYCTDNAAMIASAGYYQVQENPSYADPLDFSILPKSTIS
jgi:N6-L-threonylcarbamoyladenine synthase